MFSVPTPDFVKVVTSSNDFEIQSSELARDKAEMPAVKDFAAAMIADHTKAGEALRAALGESAPAPDAPLAPKHAAMIALLQGADGAEFEHLYIDMQVGAHMEAVSLFQTFSKSGDDPAVVSFAKATLPKLEQHKMHIKEIAGTP
jgi:putative membrane protein